MPGPEASRHRGFEESLEGCQAPVAGRRALSAAAPARARLIALLQLAYSGELAASLAYEGHARSVPDAGERAHIETVRAEELHHRELVGRILRELRAGPDPRRERRARRIGGALSALCRISGWLLPMYGAGRLESRNVREYEVAARHTRDAGLEHLVDCLLTMAEVEWEHEHYFRARVLSRRLGRWMPIWTAPPPKESIRASFLAETGRGELAEVARA
jgi:rubrerythrin